MTEQDKRNDGVQNPGRREFLGGIARLGLSVSALCLAAKGGVEVVREIKDEFGEIDFERKFPKEKELQEAAEALGFGTWSVDSPTRDLPVGWQELAAMEDGGLKLREGGFSKEKERLILPPAVFARVCEQIDIQNLAVAQDGRAVFISGRPKNLRTPYQLGSLAPSFLFVLSSKGVGFLGGGVKDFVLTGETIVVNMGSELLNLPQDVLTTGFSDQEWRYQDIIPISSLRTHFDRESRQVWVTFIGENKSSGTRGLYEVVNGHVYCRASFDPQKEKLLGWASMPAVGSSGFSADSRLIVHGVDQEIKQGGLFIRGRGSDLVAPITGLECRTLFPYAYRHLLTRSGSVLGDSTRLGDRSCRVFIDRERVRGTSGVYPEGVIGGVVFVQNPDSLNFLGLDVDGNPCFKGKPLEKGEDGHLDPDGWQTGFVLWAGSGAKLEIPENIKEGKTEPKLALGSKEFLFLASEKVSPDFAHVWEQWNGQGGFIVLTTTESGGTRFINRIDWVSSDGTSFEVKHFGY
ncbi:hypothetical protein ISS42_00070 [Candidatus Shapirobacteria bacterium]|nr:hypothetical protein [Candidatus Shapirobacteria bacterium]